MGNRHSDREGARLLQIDGKAEDHAAVYIDHHRQGRSLNRLTVFLIDHDDIHGRVIDLGDGQRKVGARKVPLDGSYFSAAAFLPLRFPNLRRSDRVAIRRRTVLAAGFLSPALKHCCFTQFGGFEPFVIFLAVSFTPWHDAPAGQWAELRGDYRVAVLSDAAVAE